MEKIDGKEKKSLGAMDLKDHDGQEVTVHGMIYRIREMSGFAFVILSTDRHLVQCVYSPEQAEFELSELNEGCAVEVLGRVIANPKVMNGAEISLTSVQVLSRPYEAAPVAVNKKELNLPLDTKLQLRPVALRNQRERAVFKIQEGIARGFRDYLTKAGFTEIHTPKIVFAGAEGGANIFKLDYFGKQVYLAQSPQFYKQTMVGVFERVFEIGPVFRAEKHDTSRHLNEYTSMDFEMGFISDFRDIMVMETNVLSYIFRLLKGEYGEELALFSLQVPEVECIPSLKFMEAKEIIEKAYQRRILDFDDFEPEEEKLICDYMKKHHGSPIVFITHYPSGKRPFYAMDDANDPGFTLSFDLLYDGLEITTGGQRIHDYQEQVNKMQRRGMSVEDFDSYLMIHRHGMPPHGGLGIGLERLTMKLLGFKNVRDASLFPRDMTRVTP